MLLAKAKKALPATFTAVAYVLLALTAAMMVYAAYEYFLIYRKLIKSDDPADYLDWQEEIRQKA